MPSGSRRRPDRWEMLTDAFETHFGAVGGVHPVGFAPTPQWRPATDVYETEDAFHVVLDLAGVRPDDIRVEVEGDTITVSGVRAERASGKRHYHVMEIQVGPFERRIRIASPIDAGAATAVYDRGYLELHLPKTAARPAGSRRVPIR